MLKLKKLFNKFISKLRIKKISTSDMYNTEIFRSGLKNLLNEYKVVLESSDINNEMKIRELDFHINILDKISADYLN
ncbi:MAG: hypothetical protein GX265_03820 [Mollicutes bacterium]|nr:hypothetical protein [Mollicutes bacterium]